MKRVKISARHLALTGLVLILAAAAWTAILVRPALQAEIEKEPSGVGVIVNSPWINLELTLLIGSLGLLLFAGVSLFTLGRIIYRRLRIR